MIGKKAFFLFLLGLALFPTANAQPPGDPSLAELDSLALLQVSPHLRVYRRARSIGDYQTAISSLHYFLLDDPENGFMQDTLVGLYASTGQFNIAANLAEEYLEKRQNSLFLLDLLAAWYDSQGKLVESLDMYSRIRKQVPQDAYTLYQVSVLELRLERYGESRSHALELTEMPGAPDARIRITIQDGAQDVPANAAAWNLIGNIDLSMGKKKEAKQAFQKALEIQPDFKLAQNNLEAL